MPLKKKEMNHFFSFRYGCSSTLSVCACTNVLKLSQALNKKTICAESYHSSLSFQRGSVVGLEFTFQLFEPVEQDIHRNAACMCQKLCVCVCVHTWSCV